MVSRLPRKLTSGNVRLKVVISGHETCGIIRDLAEELRSRGHEVVTVALSSPFFPYKYDYDQYVLPVSYASGRFGKSRAWSAAFGAVFRLSPRLHEALETWMRVRMVRDADLYVRVWGTIPCDREVLEAIAASGVRVATILMGSDVRDYRVFSQQFGATEQPIDAGASDPSRETKLASLRTHEKHADAIFSVPDQMGLALRPYHHLQVPVHLNQLRFKVPARQIPKVVHAPSRPGVKGTEIIEAALERLKRDGVEFEFVSIRNMPHEDVLSLLTDADVLVDELVFHGPGWLSFEAMASGCAVATRYLEDSPACFRPPVVPIDANNVYDKLLTLLTDQAMRVRLAEEGRRYVEKNNAIADVVDELLRKTEAGRAGGTDYVPRFLIDGYTPPNADDARKINEMNDVVRDEDWYRERIAGHSRAQLEF